MRITEKKLEVSQKSNLKNLFESRLFYNVCFKLLGRDKIIADEKCTILNLVWMY